MGGPSSSFAVTTKEPPEHPNGKGDSSYPAIGMVRSQNIKAEGEEKRGSGAHAATSRAGDRNGEKEQTLGSVSQLLICSQGILGQNRAKLSRWRSGVGGQDRVSDAGETAGSLHAVTQTGRHTQSTEQQLIKVVVGHRTKRPFQRRSWNPQVPHFSTDVYTRGGLQGEKPENRCGPGFVVISRLSSVQLAPTTQSPLVSPANCHRFR
jgi:hypothetical protein